MNSKYFIDSYERIISGRSSDRNRNRFSNLYTHTYISMYVCNYLGVLVCITSKKICKGEHLLFLKGIQVGSISYNLCNKKLRNPFHSGISARPFCFRCQRRLFTIHKELLQRPHNARCYTGSLVKRVRDKYKFAICVITAFFLNSWMISFLKRPVLSAVAKMIIKLVTHIEKLAHAAVDWCRGAKYEWYSSNHLIISA